MALLIMTVCTVQFQKLYPVFRKQEAHDARDSQSLIENVQSKAFEILKMFKNNFKFTRATC